jgi:hypothetical protein
MSDNGEDRAKEIDEKEQTEEVDTTEAMEDIRHALLQTNMQICVSGEDETNKSYAEAQSLVELSQGNDTIQEVVLCLFLDSYRGYKCLRVLGEFVGNLEALQRLTIYGRRDERGDNDDDSEITESLYWQAFAGALGRVRHPIELRLGNCWEYIKDFTNFAGAIQGLSTIQTFYSYEDAVEWRFADILISALASLPSLENVTLRSFSYEAEHPPSGEFPGLTNLLMSSSLRSIEFSGIHVTSGLSESLQAAFEGGSFVNNLRFIDCGCRGDENSGWEEDAAQLDTLRALVQALQRNSSVKSLSFVGNDFDGIFCDRVTTALLVNTTLVDLTLRVPPLERGMWLQPLFVAVRINTSLKSLNVNDLYLTDELVCGALRDMLAQNSVLEALTLHSPEYLDETSVVSWRRTLPFIRDSATLKSLTISFNEFALDSHVATVCFDTVAMLEGNTTLECLDIKSGGISPDAYISALGSLQPSSALKTIRLSPVLTSITLGVEEMNQLVLLVKTSYSLAVLDEGVSAHDKTGELDNLLRLNQAGRHYLIEDAASIAKGVEVLISVSDDLGCLFYHLLENPTLCDIEHQYSTKSGTSNLTTHHSNKRQCF